MRKVNLPFLFAIIVIFCLAFAECDSKGNETALSEQYPVDKSDTVVVELQEIKDTKVVVYETEQVSIVIGYPHFMENLQVFIDQNNVSDDILLSEKVLAMASAADSVNIAEFEGESKLIERFHYRLADMLEKGTAAVYPKESDVPTKSILVEHFVFMAHKTAGRGGGRFYLPDHTLFLEVIDWIS